MKFLVIFALALATVSGQECIEEEREGRIYDGQFATAGQFPYMVSVAYRLGVLGVSSACGGTILSDRYVLTAAHCIRSIPGAVRYGSLTPYFGGTSTIFAKSDTIIHPNYTNYQNDIALIRLRSPIQLTGTVTVATLPILSTYSTYEGSNAIICGYGATVEYVLLPSNLKWSPVKIIANTDCATAYNPGDIDVSDICASGNPGSSCRGDFGGPLVLEGSSIIVGVASYDHDCGCGNGEPTVFKRITYYRQWIYDNSGV